MSASSLADLRENTLRLRHTLFVARDWEHWLERVGERLNPVLVKETRQVLKSRHFLITFQLALLVACLVSVFSVAAAAPGFQYRESGPEFFVLYLGTLAWALFFVIPVAAFHSFGLEFDRNTIDILTLTPLSPQTIVSGKLQSACVHMLAYASALAPFLSFTYLLGGIGLVPIFLSLTGAFATSVWLCAFACMLGVLTRHPVWRTFAMLVLLALSGIAFGGLLLVSSEWEFGVWSWWWVVGFFLLGWCYCYSLGLATLLTIGVLNGRTREGGLERDPLPEDWQTSAEPAAANVPPRSAEGILERSE